MTFARPIPVVTLALLAAACPITNAGSGTSSSGQCAPGIITGGPSLEVGRGATEFVAVADGEQWTVAHGPQGGGGHVWLSIRTEGLGPDVRLTHRYETVDGTVLATTENTTRMCAGPSPTVQAAEGLTAFLPDDERVRERILCDGPFNFRITVEDDERSVEQTKRVGGVRADENSFVPYRIRCDGGLPDAH